MSDDKSIGAVEPVKDGTSQQPVATAWRSDLSAVVCRLAKGDHALQDRPSRVAPVSNEVAEQMRRSVNDYGQKILPLPDESWRSSIAQWMGGYWEVLIDLWTAEEGESDLVLFVSARELDGDYTFEIVSLHVP